MRHEVSEAIAWTSASAAMVLGSIKNMSPTSEYFAWIHDSLGNISLMFGIALCAANLILKIIEIFKSVRELQKKKRTTRKTTHHATHHKDL